MKYLEYFQGWLVEEKTNNRLSAALVLIASLLLLAFTVNLTLIYGYEVNEIKPVDYNTYECRGKGPIDKVFSFYALDKVPTKILANNLCSDARITEQFGLVRGQWKHEKIQDLRVLQSRVFTLIAVKPTHIERAEIQDVGTPYESIAAYEPYPTFLINQSRELPKLTTKYLSGKRIGLLDYPDSESGRRIPLKTFRDKGINIDLIEFINFDSHHSLRQALKSNDIDIISSYWHKDFKQNGAVVLKKNTKPTTWYFSFSKQDSSFDEMAIKCAVHDALDKTAKSSSLKYFREINFFLTCGGDLL